MLLHSSSCALKRAVSVSLLPPAISDAERGPKGEGKSLRAQSRTWKADLLNRKRFVAINRFDSIQSKTLCMTKPHKPN